ncbi:MAG: hypothetical protein J7641_19970 [Cyanobacteria bacterium SID2]|nr:hypothetical protein [Cyanobacteria bacterium SID2]MBP0004189.1 hypothetical protein [Cyanobacteria bacterium SBC]
MASTNTTTSSADVALKVDAPRSVDRYAQLALSDTAIEYEEKYPYSTSTATIVENGLSGVVANVSERFNGTTDLEETVQLLLSNTTIYAAMVKIAIDDESATDESGIYNAVLRHISDQPKTFFQAKLLQYVLNAKHVTVDMSDVKWQVLPELVAEHGLPIASGEVEPAVNTLLDIVYERGELYYYLDRYIQNGDIDEIEFTQSIKEKMLDRLVTLNLKIDPEKFDAGAYDEYFALAYHEAQTGGSATDDPIDLIYSKGGQSTWDFSVDRFETVEKQGISKNNILAAGALDYVYYIGEVMRVFDVANVLVLRWASGLLDIPDGTTASALYRFHKRRDERSTPEERAMLYKRVLNKGEGQVLSRMSVNSDFTTLWDQFISEVMQYIQKTERKAYWSNWYDSGVSNARIYQLTRDLQYNLSDHMTGMAHLQVTEDYNHLQEALEIVNSEDVRNYFGGRRQSLWNTIERICSEEFGSAPNTETIKTLAVDGNTIFQWIANFNESSVTSSQFEALLAAVEAWVLARETVEGSPRQRSPKTLPAASPPPPRNDTRNDNGDGFIAYEYESTSGDNNLAGSAVGNDEFDRW